MKCWRFEDCDKRAPRSASAVLEERMTARGYSRDRPELVPGPGKEMPVEDLRVQLNRLAVRLGQGIDRALAKEGAADGGG